MFFFFNWYIVNALDLEIDFDVDVDIDFDFDMGFDSSDYNKQEIKVLRNQLPTSKSLQLPNHNLKKVY